MGVLVAGASFGRLLMAAPLTPEDLPPRNGVVLLPVRPDSTAVTPEIVAGLDDERP